ncbi:hypothetical protein [Polymorphospora sp. A560]|uniref:hypothetical protein n=1 Tax=Polymorphospora sp. A560 TaxID=3040203 RepID=UPI0038915FF5
MAAGAVVPADAVAGPGLAAAGPAAPGVSGPEAAGVSGPEPRRPRKPATITAATSVTAIVASQPGGVHLGSGGPFSMTSTRPTPLPAAGIIPGAGAGRITGSRRVVPVDRSGRVGKQFPQSESAVTHAFQFSPGRIDFPAESISTWSDRF